ncbi:MAG: hypothetical protein NVS3B25_32470 [Hymenobacter sp.]
MSTSTAPLYCSTCARWTSGHGYEWNVFCPDCLRILACITRQVLPFGKFKGRVVDQMDSPEERRYLTWFLNTIEAIPPPLRTAILYQLGFLPMHETAPLPEWAAVLELRLPIRPDDVKGAYRTLAKKYHPDAGGSEEQMQRLNSARAQATAYLRQ